RSHGDARGEHVLPGPGVGAVGPNADWQIVHQADLPRSGRQLAIEQPLQPFVEANTATLVLTEATNRGDVGMAELSRPALPRATVDLVEGAEGRIVGQSTTLRVPVATELSRICEGGKEVLQRPHLELEDAVALDQPLPVEVPRSSRQRCQALTK